MNARPVKTTIALCLLFLSPLAASLRAQDNNVENPVPPAPSLGRGGPGFGGPRGSAVETPIFNIQIENGQLNLDPLKGRETPWTATHESSVPATIDNLSKYLRVIDTNLNIVLSPDVGNITIPNLKLNTRNVSALHQAIAIASGGAIFDNEGGGFGFVGTSENKTAPNLTFVSARSKTRPSVEVFNLSGYIQSLGKVDDQVITQKLDELKQIIAITTTELNNYNDSHIDSPELRFHPGTKLLIVIGKPEAIEVSRKIINALSGQQPNTKTNPTLDTPPASDQK